MASMTTRSLRYRPFFGSTSIHEYKGNSSCSRGSYESINLYPCFSAYTRFDSRLHFAIRAESDSGSGYSEKDTMPTVVRVLLWLGWSDNSAFTPVRQSPALLDNTDATVISAIIPVSASKGTTLKQLALWCRGGEHDLASLLTSGSPSGDEIIVRLWCDFRNPASLTE